MAPGAEPGDPAKEALALCFAAHGLPCEECNGWLLPGGQAPGVLADWRGAYPSHPLVGSLAVVVRLPDRREIIENFMGLGEGLQGMYDAFGNFAVSDLHVMLSALWTARDEDAVPAEAWQVQGRHWQAYPGPWHLRNDAPLPEGITERLRALIEAEALDKDLHWFRFFVGQRNGDFTIEALKDNEKWPSAEALLRDQDWPLRDGYYGARLFLILKHGCETAC